jgi:hypothetical protein
MLLPFSCIPVVFLESERKDLLVVFWEFHSYAVNIQMGSDVYCSEKILGTASSETQLESEVSKYGGMGRLRRPVRRKSQKHSRWNRACIDKARTYCLDT